MKSTSAANESDFILQFESGTIGAESFHHADHVRLAFAYLCKYPVLPALQKFVDALKKFAAVNGKSQLYNETVTCAYFFLIHERRAACGTASWQEFACHNGDLLTRKNGILSRYYRETTLKSDLARKVFVLPDKSFDPELISS